MTSYNADIFVCRFLRDRMSDDDVVISSEKDGTGEEGGRELLEAELAAMEAEVATVDKQELAMLSVPSSSHLTMVGRATVNRNVGMGWVVVIGSGADNSAMSLDPETGGPAAAAGGAGGPAAGAAAAGGGGGPGRAGLGWQAGRLV